MCKVKEIIHWFNPLGNSTNIKELSKFHRIDFSKTQETWEKCTNKVDKIFFSFFKFVYELFFNCYHLTYSNYHIFLKNKEIEKYNKEMLNENNSILCKVKNCIKVAFKVTCIALFTSGLFYGVGSGFLSLGNFLNDKIEGNLQIVNQWAFSETGKMLQTAGEKIFIMTAVISYYAAYKIPNYIKNKSFGEGSYGENLFAKVISPAYEKVKAFSLENEFIKLTIEKSKSQIEAIEKVIFSSNSTNGENLQPLNGNGTIANATILQPKN